MTRLTYEISAPFRLSVCAVVMGVCCLVPIAAQAQTPPDILEVKPVATFLRATPDLQGAVLTRLVQGERVQVLERGTGDWWRVRAGDPPHEGYVHRLVVGPPLAVARPTPGLPPRPTLRPRPTTRDDEPVEPSMTSGASRVRKTRGPGFLGYAGAGLFLPAARDTFDAVAITNNPLALRGGVEIVRLYKGLYLGAMVERVAETGERGFITEDGTRFGLGIPLDVELMPIEGTIGWRFEAPASRSQGRLVPFVGAGVGMLRYRENDPFAEADEKVDDRFIAYHAVAGADVVLARWVGVRLEYRYRYAPDSLGEGGLSAVTGDTSLGGSTLGVAVVIGR